MRYDNPRLRQLLAGEYVLGTLRGRARRRFEHLLLDDPALRRLVEDWEMKLNTLAESVPPVKPPERVWRAIRARIAPARPAPEAWWNRLVLWRAFAAAAALVAVMLGIQLGREPAVEPARPAVAVLTGAQNQPAWLVILGAQPGAAPSLRFTALQPQALSPDRSFELWLIPQGEGGPCLGGPAPAQWQRSAGPFSGCPTRSLPGQGRGGQPGAERRVSHWSAHGSGALSGDPDGHGVNL
ncbi:MAG: hypothetical protein KatS3mg123_2235 [Burkholderiales bacterium]|nr:MAG: hypothetical protein KatS3mg123_2235 [Burkholderiales bacterium]